jgi:hypothetical protein
MKKTAVDLPDDLAREQTTRPGGAAFLQSVEALKQQNGGGVDFEPARLDFVPVDPFEGSPGAKKAPKHIAKALLSDDRSFLDLRGSFKVGPGDPVEDVRRARKLMGSEGA